MILHPSLLQLEPSSAPRRSWRNKVEHRTPLNILLLVGLENDFKLNVSWPPPVRLDPVEEWRFLWAWLGAPGSMLACAKALMLLGGLRH